MRYASFYLTALLAAFLLPLFAFSQDQPPAKKQTHKDQSAKPRLDLYRDPQQEEGVSGEMESDLSRKEIRSLVTDVVHSDEVDLARACLGDCPRLV